MPQSSPAGVLLLHHSNRTRKAGDELAGQLAAAGINTLTLDMRGFGESGGNGKPYNRLTNAHDVDTAFPYLVSQPGVKRDVIGVGGAGWFGVHPSVEVARQIAFRRDPPRRPAIPAAGGNSGGARFGSELRTY